MATTKPTTSKSTRKVQVPGAPATTDQATQAEDATSKSTEVVDAGLDSGAAGANAGEGAARDWGTGEGEIIEGELVEETAGEAAVYVEREAPAELLDADDVDPTKISRAVLTKQGWVLPVTPAAKA